MGQIDRQKIKKRKEEKAKLKKEKTKTLVDTSGTKIIPSLNPPPGSVSRITLQNFFEEQKSKGKGNNNDFSTLNRGVDYSSNNGTFSNQVSMFHLNYRNVKDDRW